MKPEELCSGAYQQRLLPARRLPNQRPERNLFYHLCGGGVGGCFYPERLCQPGGRKPAVLPKRKRFDYIRLVYPIKSCAPDCFRRRRVYLIGYSARLQKIYGLLYSESHGAEPLGKPAELDVMAI